MIPKGWKIGALGGVLVLEYGKSLPEAIRHEGDVAVYGSNGSVDADNNENYGAGVPSGSYYAISASFTGDCFTALGLPSNLDIASGTPPAQALISFPGSNTGTFSDDGSNLFRYSSAAGEFADLVGEASFTVSVASVGNLGDDIIATFSGPVREFLYDGTETETLHMVTQGFFKVIRIIDSAYG